MLSKDKTFSLIQRSGNLPTLPAILLKLLSACDNDDTPMSDIAAIISKDPVLSFKVLQLVNSAYYGFRYSFNGIEQAVVYLGANTIKNLAVTMSVHQVFERKRFKSIKHFNINIFWHHSLMCATLAKRIALKTGFTNIDEAYLSGLLHDIGRLILISTFPKEHETILTETKDRNNTLWAEKQLLGVTHCETGGWLMQKWRLGAMMADAIRYHHEPPEKINEAFPLVKIIYIANLLCDKNDTTKEKCAVVDLLTGLDCTDILEIVEGAEEEVEQIALNLEIKVQKPDDIKNSPANNQETTPASGAESSALTGQTDGRKDLQEALSTRIKSISLLSSFLERLAQAADTEGIIAACEQAMSILFNIEKVLFFLTDKDNILLKGQTSSVNSLHQASLGLTLTLQQSSSLIVKTCLDMSPAFLTAEEPVENLADEQILTVLSSSSVLMIPLVADKKPGGVILLGLPERVTTLSTSDYKLAQVVVQQVGLCLQLEKMKEQKAAELDAERMAAVSLTARKVAHEINNPLGIISNYITAMKLKLADDGAIQNELAIIDEEIHRMSSMISQLDMFSQDPVCRLELTDVNAVINDIVQLFKSAHFAGTEVSMSFRPEATLPPIMTSKDSIKQIIINLLKNAAEAMDRGGNITVKTRQFVPEVVTDKKGIEIVVADTGPGLPESVRSSLYTPFVTTKQNGHSGLGLSIVHKTVKDLGGKISCTSNPMDGTCFSIFLPNSTKTR